MSYRRAEEVLPIEIIKLIQQYVDGENLYIPRIENTRKDWGQQTQIKEELKQRNQSIFMEYQAGYAICELSRKYFLSEKSIQRILRDRKYQNIGYVL